MSGYPDEGVVTLMVLDTYMSICPIYWTLRQTYAKKPVWTTKCFLSADDN